RPISTVTMGWVRRKARSRCTVSSVPRVSYDPRMTDGTPPVAGRCAPRSDDADLLGLGALAAVTDLELDLLAGLEGSVTRPVDVREVDEQVLAVVTGDEAVALLVVEELHGAVWHDLPSLSLNPVLPTGGRLLRARSGHDSRDALSARQVAGRGGGATP